MKAVFENIQVFIIGALLYSGLEILFRGFTHWTMFLTGGLCVAVLYNIFARKDGISIWKKCLIGAAVITGIEFIAGCIVNLLLDWNVWDYSGYAFHVLGQVCLFFTVIWFFLSAPLVWLTKKLRVMANSKLYF